MLVLLLGVFGCPQGGVGWLEFTPTADAPPSVRICGVRDRALGIPDSISGPLLVHAADSLDVPDGGSFFVKSFRTAKREPGDQERFGGAPTLRIASVQEVRRTAPLSCRFWDFVRRSGGRG